MEFQELQRVTVELLSVDRMKLDSQICSRMEQLGYKAYDYDSLGLGFHLPANWPADVNCEVTMAQLVVLSVKLNMQLVINDVSLYTVTENEPGDVHKGV